MENTLGLVYFLACAVFALIGGIVTIASKNPIRSAMGLLLTILCIAGLFLSLHAEFLAVIQLIVYAGAIVILFLFVIMLLGPSAVGPRDQRGIFARGFGSALFAICAVGAMYLVIRGGRLMILKPLEAARPGPDNPVTDFGSVDAFGRILFSDALVPFELSSALLMVAVLGAVAVAKGKMGGKSAQPSSEQDEVPALAGHSRDGALPNAASERHP